MGLGGAPPTWKGSAATHGGDHRSPDPMPPTCPSTSWPPSSQLPPHPSCLHSIKFLLPLLPSLSFGLGELLLALSTFTKMSPYSATSAILRGRGGVGGLLGWFDGQLLQVTQIAKNQILTTPRDVFVSLTAINASIVINYTKQISESLAHLQPLVVPVHPGTLPTPAQKHRSMLSLHESHPSAWHCIRHLLVPDSTLCDL